MLINILSDSVDTREALNALQALLDNILIIDTGDLQSIPPSLTITYAGQAIVMRPDGIAFRDTDTSGRVIEVRLRDLVTAAYDLQSEAGADPEPEPGASALE